MQIIPDRKQIALKKKCIVTNRFSNQSDAIALVCCCNVYEYNHRCPELRRRL